MNTESSFPWDKAKDVSNSTVRLQSAFKNSPKPYPSTLEGLIIKFMISLNYFKFTG